MSSMIVFRKFLFYLRFIIRSYDDFVGIFIHSFVYIVVGLFIHSFVYIFVCFFVHSFIHSFIYSFFMH